MRTAHHFRKPVDMRSRDAVTAYLENHFRYSTMNSWNRATSYAHNVKLHQLPVPDDAWEIVETNGFWLRANALVRAYDREHDYRYQAGFNGRSGGYLVMYTGEKKQTDHTTRCDTCGILTKYTEEQPCHVEGCGGYLEKLDSPAFKVATFPGCGIDMNEDFSGWSMDSLKDRAQLVMRFDRLADDLLALLLDTCRNSRVVTKTVYRPEKVRVLEAI